jgi:hypothetical protein
LLEPTVEIEAAQAELRRAYLRGGPGAIVSGLVWLGAGIAASVTGVPVGFAVLFFGGMLIFPVAAFIVRVVLRCPPESTANPGGLTVIETVVPMIAGLMAAWLFLPYRPDFVFPLAAVAVGAHYFGFRTAYGDWTNWVLGGVLCATGLAAIFYRLPSPSLLPYGIATLELAFGAWLISSSLCQDHLGTSTERATP